jgi:NAD(P)-dependent dehydrogenase (short-subunit alcohol dehydrogenase family)
MESIQGKKVLIAGATGGIGLETARLLKGSGATLLLIARNGERLAEAAASLGVPDNQTFQADITRFAEVQAAAERITSEFGPLDILINATGVGIIKPIETLTPDDFDRSIDVNLKGAFYLLKSFLPPMIADKKGLIINMPGVLGKSPMAGAAAYYASKYGLNGMMKAVREDIKRTNIRITNVYMGGVDTPFWDTIDLKVRRDAFIQVREAARAVWFLCQQPSSGVVSEMIIQPFNHQVL